MESLPASQDALRVELRLARGQGDRKEERREEKRDDETKKER